MSGADEPAPDYRLSDFDYRLPDELIALRPVRPRSAARLLVAKGARIADATVADLPRLLRRGDRLVLNDTRVIPARLSGRRVRQEAVARVEVTLVEPLADGDWRALVKPLRRIRSGETIQFAAGLAARATVEDDGTARLSFDRQGEAFDAALAAAGTMPLPPYIETRRRADMQDRTDYQTIWAEKPGAVAAPTASLHFDAALMEALAARGVETTRVTLHVGAGTFLPVKHEDLDRHRMHSERGEVGGAAAEELNRTRRDGGRIIPVGTTALRLIESAAGDSGEILPFRGRTDLFIRPGYRFRAADGLVTNFHLPRSTLLMLVSALMGYERTRRIYAHAIDRRYRFFSYGDASLLFPED